MEAKRFRPEHTDARAIAQAVWAGVHGVVSLFIVMGEVPHFQWRHAAELVLGSQLRGLLRDRPGMKHVRKTSPPGEPEVAAGRLAACPRPTRRRGSIEAPCQTPPSFLYCSSPSALSSYFGASFVWHWLQLLIFFSLFHFFITSFAAF